jgi:hypothetical protein
VCGAISLLGSVTFAIYNDVLINAFMLVLIAGLFSIYALGISDSFKHKQGSYKILLDMATQTFVIPHKNYSNVFGSIKASFKGNKKSLGAIAGVLAAIPFLLVIVPLLVSSDAAFEGLVSTVLENIGVYILELCLALIALPYFFSYMFAQKHRLNKKTNKGRKVGNRKMPVSASVSFLCMISLTYLAYLFSQLAYFFSTFSGILPSDYNKTASEFARRGFYEMFAICVINIAILSVVSAISKRDKNGKVSMIIKAFSCFISLFSVLLIITAMSKMKFNVATYGLSVNRLLVSVFMVMLLVIIAFFVMHIFTPKIKYMQCIVIFCSVLFVGVVFTGVDAQVVKYNIEANQSGKLSSFSWNDMYNLDDSTLPYLVEIAANNEALSSGANDLIANKVACEYYQEIEFHDGIMNVDSPNDLRQFNLSRQRAVNAIFNYYISLSDDEQKKLFENYDDYDDYDDYYVNA